MERKGSPRIPELRQRHEVSCMLGLFSVIESCQCRRLASRKLISNGRPPVNEHTIDYPRKLDGVASFDEECRRIQLQNEADLASVTVEDIPFEKHKTKRNIVKGHQHCKPDPELIDLLVKTHKRAKQNSQEPYQSSLCRSSNAPGSFPSTSSDLCLNELTLAAILKAVSAQNHQKESIQMSAKAFVDQMFIRSKLISESKSSAGELGMPDSNKDLVGERFSDPNTTTPKRIKNFRHHQTEKETLKSILDAKECEGLDSEKPGNELAARKGKMDKNLRTRKSSFVTQPSDRIVILKPAPQNAKYSEDVTCHCSSLQPHKKSSRRVLDVKPISLFSFGEMKKKLKRTFRGARKEPSVGISSNKQDFDVMSEAKKHLSARFKNLNAVETMMSEKSLKTLGRILSSPEHEVWPVNPRKDGQHGSGPKVLNGREGARLIPLREAKTEVLSCDVYNKYDSSRPIMDTTSSDEKTPDTYISATDDMKFNGESKIVETGNVVGSQLHTSETQSDINSYDVTRTMQIADTDELQKADENDSVSENEVSTSTVDKYQYEHRSPISVLEPFFIEDANSPPSVTLKTDGHQLKPRRLDFEQCSLDSFPQDPPIDANSCMQEHDHISQYVHLVLQASCLNWDQLSEITTPPDELLNSVLFDEVEFLPDDCYFDPKLLFDRINEVLLEIYKYHFGSPHWLAFLKPKMGSVPLAKLVLNKIMMEADFFLLPRTEIKTLDQLVSKDVEKCGSWIDIQRDTEEIVIEISEDFAEEFILDILVEFYT